MIKKRIGRFDYMKRLSIFSFGLLYLYFSTLVAAKSLQTCPALCDPMDCNPPGSSVHGILQAAVLEWVAISSFRVSSWPRDWTHVSCIAGGFLTPEPSGRWCHIWISRIIFYFVVSPWHVKLQKCNFIVSIFYFMNVLSFNLELNSFWAKVTIPWSYVSRVENTFHNLLNRNLTHKTHDGRWRQLSGWHLGAIGQT